MAGVQSGWSRCLPQCSSDDDLSFLVGLSACPPGRARLTGCRRWAGLRLWELRLVRLVACWERLSGVAGFDGLVRCARLGHEEGCEQQRGEAEAGGGEE